MKKIIAVVFLMIFMQIVFSTVGLAETAQPAATQETQLGEIGLTNIFAIIAGVILVVSGSVTWAVKNKREKKQSQGMIKRNK